MDQNTPNIPQGTVTKPKGKTDPESLSEDEKLRFKALVKKGKEQATQGRIQAALETNKKALLIYHSEKVAKKCVKMEVRLAGSASVIGLKISI